MKPVLFKHSEAIKDSYFVLNDRGPHFYDTLHYHPEYQLTVINEGVGTFFIADHIERFEPGDIFLIGPDLPHVFRNDNEYYLPTSKRIADYTGAYFTYNSFGERFFELNENSNLRSLLLQAQRGIKIAGPAAAMIAPQLLSLQQLNGVRKITTLLLILEEMSQVPSTEKYLLSSVGFLGSMKNDDNERMNQVFDYLMKHFTEDISLDQVAAIACMTNTAFCRFFKKRTRKGLIEFITEARVGYACKLLLEEKYTVSEVAAKSGFNNISNFNRQFKSITTTTPLGYLRLFRAKLGVEN